MTLDEIIKDGIKKNMTMIEIQALLRSNKMIVSYTEVKKLYLKYYKEIKGA